MSVARRAAFFVVSSLEKQRWVEPKKRWLHGSQRLVIAVSAIFVRQHYGAHQSKCFPSGNARIAAGKLMFPTKMPLRSRESRVKGHFITDEQLLR